MKTRIARIPSGRFNVVGSDCMHAHGMTPNAEHCIEMLVVMEVIHCGSVIARMEQVYRVTPGFCE